MKKGRFTEEQIIGVLKQHEAGRKVPDLAQEIGVSAATIYTWKSKYGGMDVSDAQTLKGLEDENRRLKHGRSLESGAEQPGMGVRFCVRHSRHWSWHSILAVVDAFTRENLSLEVDTSLSSRRVTRSLEDVIEHRENWNRFGATTVRSSPAGTS